MTVKFNEVGFIGKYYKNTSDYYIRFFDTEEDMLDFFKCVFANDEIDKTPRRMMNQIVRWIELSDDLRELRPGKDALNIISDGCLNCYAARMAKRLKAMGNLRYVNEFQLTLQEDLLDVPLKIKQPKLIFVNSMSDLFHEDVPDDYILKVFDTMNRAKWHTFQVLTKRPERALAMDSAGKLKWSPNIWMGTTVENSKYIDRIDILRKMKADIKFISFEPLLGRIKIANLEQIDWVIVGGESGPKSREIKKDWIIEIRDNCRSNDVAFFFKQWGGTNKKKSGRVLDGNTYDEYPKQVKAGK